MFGFEFLTNDGHTQLSPDDVHLCLKQGFTIDMVDDPATHPQPMMIAEVEFSAGLPLVAIRTEGAEVCVYNVDNTNGTTWKYALRARRIAQRRIYVYVFDVVSNIAGAGASTGVGLQLFKSDGSGTLVYDTIAKPLRIVGVVNTGEQLQRDDVAVPSGRLYAAVQGTGAFYFSRTLQELDPGGGPAGWTYRYNQNWQSVASGGFQTIGAGMAEFETWYSHEPTSVPDIAVTYGSCLFFLVDVTGY